MTKHGKNFGALPPSERAISGDQRGDLSNLALRVVAAGDHGIDEASVDGVSYDFQDYFGAAREALLVLLKEVETVNATARANEAVLTPAGRGHDAACQGMALRIQQMIAELKP